MCFVRTRIATYQMDLLSMWSNSFYANRIGALICYTMTMRQTRVTVQSRTLSLTIILQHDRQNNEVLPSAMRLCIKRSFFSLYTEKKQIQLEIWIVKLKTVCVAKITIKKKQINFTACVQLAIWSSQFSKSVVFDIYLVLVTSIIHSMFCILCLIFRCILFYTYTCMCVCSFSFIVPSWSLVYRYRVFLSIIVVVSHCTRDLCEWIVSASLNPLKIRVQLLLTWWFHLLNICYGCWNRPNCEEYTVKWNNDIIDSTTI